MYVPYFTNPLPTPNLYFLETPVETCMMKLIFFIDRLGFSAKPEH